MSRLEWVRLALVLALLSVPMPGARADEVDADGWTEVPLKIVAYKQGRSKEGYEHLPFTCPRSLEAGSFVQSGSQQYLPLPNQGKPGVPVTTLETSLEIDADGDGKVDAKAKGKDTCVPLKLVAADGTPFDYLVRITRVEISATSVDWIFQRSCAMEGTFQKTRIRLIDDDSNGVYGEFGRDAIAIGADADHAAPFGPIVNIGNELYRARANATGTSLWLKPYDGPTGFLDVFSGYHAKGKLVWAVFEGAGSWFDAAVRGGKPEVKVPAGTYRLAMGRVYNRPQGARIRAGSMKEIEVKTGETAKLEWGGPVKIVFDFQVTGRVVRLGPAGGCGGMSSGMAPPNLPAGAMPRGMVMGGVGEDGIAAVGRAGEEYWRFEPEDMTPQVQVRNATTKKAVHKGNIELRADPRTYHPAWWMWRREYSEQVKNEQGPFEVKLVEDQFTKLWPEFLVGEWK